jgi:hypothetical protein
MVDIYQVQLRNGTAAQVDTFTGASGELTYDTDTGQLRVHDGSTVGGFKLAQAGGAANFSTITATTSVTTPLVTNAGTLATGVFWYIDSLK